MAEEYVIQLTSPPVPPLPPRMMSVNPRGWGRVTHGCQPTIALIVGFMKIQWSGMRAYSHPIENLCWILSRMKDYPEHIYDVIARCDVAWPGVLRLVFESGVKALERKPSLYFVITAERPREQWIGKRLALARQHYHMSINLECRGIFHHDDGSIDWPTTSRTTTPPRKKTRRAVDWQAAGYGSVKIATHSSILNVEVSFITMTARLIGQQLPSGGLANGWLWFRQHCHTFTNLECRGIVHHEDGSIDWPTTTCTNTSKRGDKRRGSLASGLLSFRQDPHTSINHECRGIVHHDDGSIDWPTTSRTTTPRKKTRRAVDWQAAGCGSVKIATHSSILNVEVSFIRMTARLIGQQLPSGGLASGWLWFRQDCHTFINLECRGIVHHEDGSIDWPTTSRTTTPPRKKMRRAVDWQAAGCGSVKIATHSSILNVEVSFITMTARLIGQQLPVLQHHRERRRAERWIGKRLAVVPSRLPHIHQS
ncbi:hypothetical protein J6590_001955 [Homalodisca vitripennis]|nr:hypothetical protein J6590_001955 [Homalodisca vitripennis]